MATKVLTRIPDLCVESGLNGQEDVPMLVRRYLEGDIDVDDFVSHRISLRCVIAFH